MRTGLFAFLSIIFLVFSCELDYLPPESDQAGALVVEGYVEHGDGSLPVYVVLTKTLPFIGTVDSSEFSRLFVQDAQISVDDGSQVVDLELICLSDLPMVIREQIAESFQLINGTTEFCIYFDVNDNIDRRIGGSYDLSIKWQGREISATTTIPEHVPLESLYFKEPAGTVEIDTMAELKASISDIPGEANYYRYFTRVVPRPYTSGVASVTDDGFFDGETFEFTINRHAYFDEEIETRTFGLFPRNDSIEVKWCNMDKAHFDFWNTLEFNNQNQGPFSSFTRISSNVNGALGVWGGYAISQYRLRVPNE